MLKKIMKICLVVVLFFSMSANVYASRVTLNQIRDVINQMPWGTGELAGVNVNAEISGNRITLTGNVSAPPEPALQERLEFVLNGNVLTGTLSYANLNLDTEEGSARAYLREMLMDALIETVGQLHGFSENEFMSVLETDAAAAFTISEHGVSIQENDDNVIFAVDLSRRPAVGRFANTGDDPNHGGTTNQPNTNFETISALVLFVILPLGLLYHFISQRKLFFKL